MLLFSSPPPAQAASAMGSSTMATRCESFGNAKPRRLSRAENRRFARKWEFAKPRQKEHRPAAIGEAMADGPGLSRWTRRGNVDRTASPGEQDQSAPVAVMTMVEVPAVVTMMSPPVRVGVEHLRAERRGLDHRRMRGLVGCRERWRGENGN